MEINQLVKRSKIIPTQSRCKPFIFKLLILNYLLGTTGATSVVVDKDFKQKNGFLSIRDMLGQEPYKGSLAQEDAEEEEESALYRSFAQASENGAKESDEKDKDSKKEGSNHEASITNNEPDSITQLGGQACIMTALIVLKFGAQCFGVDSPNDGESSNTSYFRLHEAFQYPAQKMLGQAMYVVFVIAIVDILNINAFHSSSLELMIEAAFIAILLWILVGFYIIYHAQNQMKKWYSLEVNAHDSQQLDDLHGIYQDIYDRYEVKGKIHYNKLENNRQEIEYLILRLIFINPVNLPIMTESYLRKDFHFAMYLAYCYGKVLTKFFKWSLFSLILLLVLIIIINLTFDAIPDESARLYIKFSGLVLCFIIMILIRSCLSTAEKQITPSIYDEITGGVRNPKHYNIRFNQAKSTVDPFVQAKELPRMAYLEFDEKTTELNDGELEQLNNDEERQALLDQSLASARGAGGQQARSLLAQDQLGKEMESGKDAFNVANKHENLYCCGRRGVNFLIINTVQFFFILSVLFLSFAIATAPFEFSKDLVAHMVILVFAIILLIWMWFGLIPSILTSYTLTTNIEMMKDREQIHKVISIQRMERTKRSFRIYQVLKLIRREMIVEFRKQIPDKKMDQDNLKHVIESFLLCGNVQDKNKGKVGPIIRNDQIFSLIRLCGGSTCLTKEECFILLKKIHVNQKVAVRGGGAQGHASMDNARARGPNPAIQIALAHIQLHNFIKATEMVMNDVKLDPYILVSKLLATYYSGMEKIKFQDFRQFFLRFESYFQGNDVDLFLQEVKLLQRRDELVDINEIASMIRNDIECMPR